MAKSPSAKKKTLRSKTSTFSRRGRKITVSVPFTWTMQKEMHLKANDTLLLTLRMVLDANDFAKIIESEGPPPKGSSFLNWSKKLASKVVTAGLEELLRKGVDLWVQ